MSQENLSNQAAIQQLKELVDKIDICLFCTDIQDYKMNVAPMSRQEVEENGSIWFIGHKDSETCMNIERDNRVALHFGDPSQYQFLVVSGTAQVSQDKSRIERYWNKMMDAWFETGQDDPAIRVIEVRPENAKYWTNKDGKLMTLLKFAASAITGENYDPGKEGILNI